VAILAHGRLVASGALNDMVSLESRGWELVMANVPAPLAGSLAKTARVNRIVQISEERFAFELPVEPPPERLVGELTAAGARLVSLNPIRDTLEEIFVRRVADAPARERSGAMASPRATEPGCGAEPR
jgi:ABC-2 type transport system ATP-binding protein